MTMLQSALGTFLELTTIYIIWTKLEPNMKNQLVKKIAIILLFTLSTLLINTFHIQKMLIFINFIFIFVNVIVFKIDKGQILFQSAISFGTIVITQVTLLQIIIFLKGNYLYTFLSGLVTNTICVMLAILIYKFGHFDELSKLYIKYKNTIDKVVFVLASLVAVFLISWKEQEEITTTKINKSMISLLFMILFIIIVSYYLYSNIRVKQKEKQLKIEKGYSELLKEILDELRRVQHDHKNHLTTLMCILEGDSKDKESIATSYIEGLGNKTKKENYILNIENPIVGAVLWEKMSKAENAGISFESSIETSKIDIKPYEIVEVLGNILDNAIEACLMTGFEDTIIKFYIRNEEKKILIELFNSVLEEKFPTFDKMVKKGYSTKSGDKRGYGVYNVNAIVKSYEGDFNIFLKDGLAVTRILI